MHEKFTFHMRPSYEVSLNILCILFKVPETEDEGSTPPDFQEFSNMLLNAQRAADAEKKSQFFTWKGYKACVSSEIPKFTTRELSRRYKLALECIKKAENNEFFKTTQMSSASGRSSSSSGGSSSSISLEDVQHSQELSQIPATQLQGNEIQRKNDGRNLSSFTLLSKFSSMARK